MDPHEQAGKQLVVGVRKYAAAQRRAGALIDTDFAKIEPALVRKSGFIRQAKKQDGGMLDGIGQFVFLAASP